MAKYSSVQRRNLREAGLLSYAGGAESGSPNKQMITPDPIPSGSYNLGELGNPELPVESNSEMNQNIITSVVSIQKIRETMAILQSVSVDLNEVMNGMFGAESNNIAEIGASLNDTIDILSEKLLFSLLCPNKSASIGKPCNYREEV